ncbi:hypothetical protein E2P73_23285 [Xanthomonas perforans]|nr:hypothetical protein E2P72_23040 [Xanthomonas perforans]TVS59644.1 hypothetical protein E2P73_23285 [Xanthomonas perforans]
MDAARRPPQGSRSRPLLIHSPRAALPIAVGDSSTYPQASGKLWIRGGRACRLQIVLVLSTGRGPRPAASGGSDRLAEHARWARGGRVAPASRRPRRRHLVEKISSYKT